MRQLTLLIALLVFSIPSRPCADELPFSLTISGGISLGSYEAGVNWALIEYMRNIREGKIYSGTTPSLTMVTGASAGAINAVMTAMLWCVDPGEKAAFLSQGLPKDTVDDNLLRNAWLAVGIDQLLPAKDDRIKYCDTPVKRCEDEKKKDKKNDNKKDKDDAAKADDVRSAGVLPDAMFARGAFQDSIDLFRNLVTRKVFLPNRAVDIALLATRETPIDISLSKVRVKNQRFVFLLQFRTDSDGNGYFTSQPVRKKKPGPEAAEQEIIDLREGTVVYLPETMTAPNGDKAVALGNVIRLMYASSAFPVFFSKVNVPYCTKDYEPGTKQDDQACPRQTFLTSADFIDGGVFDNVPLGVALALRKARIRSENPDLENRDLVKEASKNYFFFISPSNRRVAPVKFKDPLFRKPPTFGLDGMTAFVSGFLAAASDHELYTVIRGGACQQYDDTTPPEGTDALPKLNLVATDRFFPITGIYLGHFGAFLDKPFREFDYNTGVYDSIIDATLFMNFIEEKKVKDAAAAGRPRAAAKAPVPDRTIMTAEERARKDAQLARRVHTAYIDLGLERHLRTSNMVTVKRNETAADVFSLIASQEYGKGTAYPEWQWINSQLPDTKGTMYAIFKSIIDTSPVLLSDEDGNDTFPEFIKNLQKNKYIESIEKHSTGSGTDEHVLVPSHQMNWMISKYKEDPVVWYTPLVRTAGIRLRKLQVAEYDEIKNGSAVFLAKTASLGADRYFNYENSSWSMPNSVPRGEQQSCGIHCSILPYEFAADTSNGISLSWLLRYKQTPDDRVSIDLKLTPSAYRMFKEDFVVYSRADLYFSYSNNKYSLGLGPTYNYLYSPPEGYGRNNLGAAAYLEFLQTVRVTAGLIDITPSGNLSGQNFYWTIGLVDIPGLFSHYRSDRTRSLECPNIDRSTVAGK